MVMTKHRKQLLTLTETPRDIRRDPLAPNSRDSKSQRQFGTWKPGSCKL